MKNKTFDTMFGELFNKYPRIPVEKTINFEDGDSNFSPYIPCNSL